MAEPHTPDPLDAVAPFLARLLKHPAVAPVLRALLAEAPEGGAAAEDDLWLPTAEMAAYMDPPMSAKAFKTLFERHGGLRALARTDAGKEFSWPARQTAAWIRANIHRRAPRAKKPGAGT